MDEGSEDIGLESSRILEVNRRMERDIEGCLKSKKKHLLGVGVRQNAKV